MIYAYYPGCSLHSTGKEYDISFRAVCKKIGIELKEVNNWICCGASSAHQVSFLLSLSLPVKNLVEVEKQKQEEVVIPCAACYSRFKTAVYYVSNNHELMEKVNMAVNSQFENKVKILHPLEIFTTDKIELIRKNIKYNLSKVKVVCYYGCLLTRPPDIMQFDICEYPMSMDKILKDAGITTCDWSYKTDCCGAALSITKSEIVLKLANDILKNAQETGADAIAVACPLCHANLDTRQDEVNKTYGKSYNLPIVYFTQLLGLSLGFAPKELGLKKHFVSADKLLKKIN